MNKWAKYFFGISFFVLLALVIFCGFEISAMLHKRSLETHNKNFFELQEKCARQSREEFKSQGNNIHSSSFTNHYNMKMNKCFLLIEDNPMSSGTLWTYKFLSDAFEGKSYASYGWHTVEGKKYWEVSPVICSVTLPSGEEKLCKSSDEFDELIKIYME